MHFWEHVTQCGFHEEGNLREEMSFNYVSVPTPGTVEAHVRCHVLPFPPLPGAAGGTVGRWGLGVGRGRGG